MAHAYQPLKPGERLIFLDFLRGIALFGILMVNLPLMNAPFTTEIGEFAIWTDKANRITAMLIRFFFTGKFYVMFSLLFGIGFYYFMNKVTDKDNGILGIFAKRLAWLFIFGVLHVLFLWYGDILVIYSLMGFALMLFRNCKNKTLLIWAGALLIFPNILIGLLVLLIQFAMNIPEAAGFIEEAFIAAKFTMAQFSENAIQTYSSGSFGEIFVNRAFEYMNMSNAFIFYMPNVVAMFLIGIVLARKKVFEDLNKNYGFFVKLLLWSLPFGIAGSFAYAYTASNISFIVIDQYSLYNMLGASIGGPALGFVYISLIALIYRKGLFKKIITPISRMGRMALTNYLMQSIICTTIFYSYGFGLYGKVNYWQGVIMVIAIYFVQVTYSYYWLKFYRFGIFEWVWRSLTYGKKQKMKLE